jgi:hypothetical protein
VNVPFAGRKKILSSVKKTTKNSRWRLLEGGLFFNAGEFMIQKVCSNRFSGKVRR